MFQQLSERFYSVLDHLKGRGKLDESQIEATLREIRLNLLEADVNFRVVREFCEQVKARALGSQVHQSLRPDQQFLKFFHEELIHLMGAPGEISFSHKPPVVILLAGLQGAGKTTTAAKLALHLKKEKGRFPFLVPADVQRPAAIDQLKTLAHRLEIPVYDTHSKDDPIKVCRRAVDFAKDQGLDTVILDTAGRLQIDKDMMKELAKIQDKVEVHHKILVVDAMAGQESVNVAQSFNEFLKISGVILTKMDGDARGGAALSVRFVTGVPILFAGMGERPEDLEPFYPDRVASRILGMGDMLSLIEKAQREFDQDETKKTTERILKNTLNFEDFLTQLQQMKKLGSMDKILGMLPGAGKLMDKVDPQQLEREVKRKQAIIQSMTPQERRNPHLLNGRRRLRIAMGSGTQVSEVNRLIKEFEQMKKMMSRFSKFSLKGMKGLRGLFPGA